MSPLCGRRCEPSTFVEQAVKMPTRVQVWDVLTQALFRKHSHRACSRQRGKHLWACIRDDGSLGWWKQEAQCCADPQPSVHSSLGNIRRAESSLGLDEEWVSVPRLQAVDQGMPFWDLPRLLCCFSSSPAGGRVAVSVRGHKSNLLFPSPHPSFLTRRLPMTRDIQQLVLIEDHVPGTMGK